MQGNLAADGYSAQVEAQGARRLTVSPIETGGGSLTMIDEIRGLRQQNVGGIMVELGANDAIGVAIGTEPLNTMLAKIDSSVTEMVGYGICIVLVTAPQKVTNVPGVDGNAYLNAVTQINNRYRLYANSNPNDNLKVIDWATWSGGHQATQADPWYNADNLHPNLAGKLQLTATLKNGAEMC